MYRIIITDKVTREEDVLQTVSTADKAESFCESWGWSYDDGERSYWLGYEEVLDLDESCNATQIIADFCEAEENIESFVESIIETESPMFYVNKKNEYLGAQFKTGGFSIETSVEEKAMLLNEERRLSGWLPLEISKRIDSFLEKLYLSGAICETQVVAVPF